MLNQNIKWLFVFPLRYAGQLLSRGSIVLLRKTIPQDHNLKISRLARRHHLSTGYEMKGLSVKGIILGSLAVVIIDIISSIGLIPLFASDMSPNHLQSSTPILER